MTNSNQVLAQASDFHCRRANEAFLRLPAPQIVWLDDPEEDTSIITAKIPSISSGKMEKSLSFREPAELVTIIVCTPPNQQEFKLPKNVVSHYSPFFETAFKSQFIEGQTQSITLEDVEGEVFGCMVHWFYTQKVETQSVGTHVDDLPKLVKLWILAERCIVPRLQNSALEHIYKHLSNIFNPFPIGNTIPDTLKQVIDVIFNSSERHDILRKLLVDHCTAHTSKALRTLIPHVPQALIIGIILEMSKDRDACKLNHRMPKVEEYQVEIPGEKKVQPAIEKEGAVKRRSYWDLSGFEMDDGPWPRPKRVTRSIKTSFSHGPPAAN